jgi:hypothetical protein
MSNAFSRGSAFLLLAVLVGGTVVACDSGGSPPEENLSNRKPTVSIEAPNDEAEYSKNGTITFEGSATDPETGALENEELQWKSVIDGPFGTGEETSTAGLSPDVHQIILTATDSVGETGSDTISVRVNGPPSVEITSPSDQSASKENEQVVFRANASDPVDGDLKEERLNWLSDVDATIGSGETAEVSSLSPGPHTISFSATDEDGNIKTDSIDIVVEEQGFNIRFRYADQSSESKKETIEEATDRWRSVITGDLQPFFIGEELSNATGIPEGGIDDLAITVRVRDIDGSGGTLAQAAPFTARSANGDYTTASSGIIQIDEADLNNSQLETIITHEIGHVLGIGSLWDNVSGLNTVNPYHTGSNTTKAFESLNGSEAYLGDGVPLERLGGEGTARAHWAETNFGNELMTGTLNSGRENPLSAVTISALKDIGYSVSQQAAESYLLSNVQATFISTEADVTLSGPTRSDENFGTPKGEGVDSVLVAGSNTENLWLPQTPEEEVFSSLLRFDLSSVAVPSGVGVSSAVLALQSLDVRQGTQGGNIEVYTAGGEWTETFATEGNQPSRGEFVSEFGINSCNPFCGKSVGGSFVDVTGITKEWLGRRQNRGLYLQAADTTSSLDYSIGFPNRHVKRDPILRPFLVLLGTQGQAALNPKRELVREGGMRKRNVNGREISMENDILDQTVYGKSPSGEIMKRKVK